MKITIEIDDATASKLQTITQRMTKPPKKQADGSTLIEPMFPTLGDFIAEILSANFQQHLGADQDEAITAKRKQIEALETEIRSRFRPTVQIGGTASAK
jgi:hypothetical protein